MSLKSTTGQTDIVSELAGEATVDSQPSERNSNAGENGLDTDTDEEISLPGPVYRIDEETDVDTQIR